MKRFSLILFTLCIAFLAAGILINNNQDALADDGRVIFSGVDLSCDGCQSQMETSLDKIIGIQNYEIDAESKSVTVWFDNEVMKPEWINKSLEAAGFYPKSMK
ncbi:heavy-metal-associated domain-containing protein [Pseudalkalibacillus caeni]|uniref:HMA domain-containing protein n=1 Tax=Exobacillus caeni TaxID=2574798 RepID=A0A5R9F0V9_9BACL|nr:heavy metal-associated domain-containing protein [Pseudalkalibacillus caeni]TLS35068.1 hypothetical protein FCL54_22365 [Pseudalkalibacillus caeni]